MDSLTNISTLTKSPELLWTAESSETIRDLLETLRDIIQDNARKRVLSEHRPLVTTADVEASLKASLKDFDALIFEATDRDDASR